VSEPRNASPVPLRVALFDFDGTVVNTTPLILRCFHATWQQVCELVNDESEYIQTFGLPLQTAMEQMAARFAAAGRFTVARAQAALVDELISTYRSFNECWHDEMIEAVAGMAETLPALKARGWRLGIVTSKKRVGLERGLRLFELTELFDVTVCAEDSLIHKPRPEPLLLAMQQLEANPNETIYVGDSTHDLVAGRAAHMRTAAATWGPFPRAELEQLQPDYLLERPEGLLELI
jgi:pyrophosphatase PpaX